MCDYRNTKFCTALSHNIKAHKKILQDIILKECHGQKNIYRKVRDKSMGFFRIFAGLYNNKCAYCGISSDVYDLKQFEIDHFICRASFENENLAGQIKNLRFSCSFCNRKKGRFFIDKKYQSLLDPDNLFIKKIFKRAADYQIVISEEYKNDVFIKQFYTQLAFDNQFRRIDFLLMNMINYSKTIENKTIKDKLNSCIELLRRKKNNLLF